MLNVKSILLALSGAVLVLTGCSTVGLGNVPKTREGYNQALNQSDNEQFLMNIVRLHYDKSPFFVGVDSITTRTTLKYSTGGDDTKVGNATNGRNFPALGAFWNVQPNIEFTTSPTITYSPLQGTSYISGLLTPIDITKFYYLAQSNLSLSAVFKLTVEQIGNQMNLSELSDATQFTYDNKGFNDFVGTLDDLRHSSRAGVFLGNYQKNQVLIVASYDDAAAAKLSQLLKLKKPYRKIILSRFASNNVSGNVVKFQTRSFFSVLNYLSKGVIAPAETEKGFGVASRSSLNQQQQINLARMTDGLFQMQSSESEPKNSRNKIEYEGRWYYIPNSDINSKATLMLVKLMYALQAGEVTDSTWSVLNIPVADE